MITKATGFSCDLPKLGIFYRLQPSLYIMTPSLPPKLLDEICDVGKLESFRAPLTDLLTRMYADGLKVSTRYDVGFSSILNNHIRVTLTEIVHPLDIIWELMHEYGHFLSGERKRADTDIGREEKAWDYADKLFLSIPGLQSHSEEYQVCKERCLESYRKFKPF